MIRKKNIREFEMKYFNTKMINNTNLKIQKKIQLI